MTENIWTYEVIGLDADGNDWTVTGFVTCEFGDAFETANRDCFQRLTSGKAVFGNPGAGCKGPYKIQKFTLEHELSVLDLPRFLNKE